MYSAIEGGESEATKFYNSWINYVKKTVPANRLLVFEAKEGWTPLCNFLNLPIPDQPYPHVNDTATITWNFKKLRIVAYTTMYGIPILAAILTATIMFS